MKQQIPGAMKAKKAIIKKHINLQNLRVLACLFVLIAFSNAAMAQYGVKMGTTLSNFYYPGGSPVPYKGYDIDLRPYLGYDVELVQLNPQKPLFSTYISVYRKFNLTDRIGLQPALAFTQKGVNFSLSTYEEITYKVKINYAEIPISFSYQFVQKEKILSEVYLGGFIAYRINAHKKVATHNKAVEKIKVNTVNDFDGGVHLGGNAKYQVKNHFLVLDLSLFAGLKDIFTAPDNWTDIYTETHKTKITGLYLSIGYEL